MYQLSKRGFIAASAGILGSGCLGSSSSVMDDSDTPQVSAGWEFQSEKPIIDGSGLEGTSGGPLGYATLIHDADTGDRIRWDYLEQISSDFVREFRNVDYAEQFLSVVEFLVPATHELSGVETTFEGDEMDVTYELEDARPENREIIVANDIEKYHVLDAARPSQINFKVVYQS